MSKINDHLYLCGMAELKIELICEHGITHIFNCTTDMPNINAPGVEFTRINVEDLPGADLGTHFDKTADDIHKVHQQGGKVLVHCVAGVSRSASIFIVYLVKYQGMALDNAYYHVKKCRKVIHPNIGFWRQLINYEKRVLGKNSVEMVTSAIGFIPDVYRKVYGLSQPKSAIMLSSTCRRRSFRPELGANSKQAMSKINDHLYLCGMAELKIDLICEHGITHILNCTTDMPNINAPGVKFTRINVEDFPCADIGTHFDKAADDIYKVHQQDGKVLVHCVAGVSRSASICIAYLVKYQGLALDKAYYHVKECRKVIRPNFGFWEQLVDYEKGVRGKNSVEMITSVVGYIPDVYRKVYGLSEPKSEKKYQLA